MEGSDVVMFVGPPFSGRWLYYFQELKDRYVRVSAREIYCNEPNSNLRLVIKRIVAELNKGHKVVIDDCNVERQTRLSYISGISKKIPECSFSCLQFTPSHGIMQLCLCMEWSLAQQALQSLLSLSHMPTMVTFSNVHEIATQIDSCSVPVKDLLLDQDKYRSLSLIETPLICPSSHQFTSPVLIVQWEGMIETGSKGIVMKEGVADAFQKWSQVNAIGNIVVIQSGKQKGTGADGWKQSVAVHLTSLSEQILSLVCPLHYISAEDLCVPGLTPNVGLVAWAQYLFTASLNHKSSLYIYYSKSHQLCAEQLGMRNIQASKVFSRPHTVNTVHYTDHEAQSVLQDIAFVDTDHFGWPSIATSRFSRQSLEPTRTLPLYPLAKLLENSPGRSSVHASYDISTSTYLLEYGDVCTSSHKCVSAYAGAGRVLGMVYGDWISLERFCERYQQSLTTVTTSHIEFTWSQQTGGRPDASAMLQGKTSPVGHTKRAGVSDVQLVNHTPGYAEPGPSTSTGRGTSDLPYRVTANVSANGSITESHCTCKAGERFGQCKHVVAMLLLELKKRKSARQGDMERPGNGEPTQREVEPMPPNERSLPQWIQDYSSQEGTICSTKAKGHKHKRDFEEEKNEEAFRLTEADLLKTALEVISMANPLCIPQKKSSNQLNAGSEENLAGSSKSTDYCCITEPPNRDDNKGAVAAALESFSLESIHETQQNTSSDTVAQIVDVGGGTKHVTDSLNFSTKQPESGLSGNGEGSILDELFY